MISLSGIKGKMYKLQIDMEYKACTAEGIYCVIFSQENNLMDITGTLSLQKCNLNVLEYFTYHCEEF